MGGKGECQMYAEIYSQSGVESVSQRGAWGVQSRLSDGVVLLMEDEGDGVSRICRLCDSVERK